MKYKLPGYRQLAFHSLAAGVGGLLIGVLGAPSALAEGRSDVAITGKPVSSLLSQTLTAQTTDDEQSRPTFSELLRTVPERRTESSDPVASPSSQPAPLSQPAAEPTPSTETSTEQDADAQAVRLLLKISERKVYVYRGETVEAVYPVAVGRAGWETPTGEFSVFHKLVDPGWTNPLTNEVMTPGPDNPLGERWIAFWTDDNNVIGFHGTPNRESVGTAASHGCVRMYNEHVRELYDMVALGTPVVVEP